MLAGWDSVAEIVSCGQGAIRRCTEPRRDCADHEPADVVGGIPRCRGQMVSDVAVAHMEWAGRGIPNVYHCRCGVFGRGATRANSRLIGKPSFTRLVRHPGVSGIDSHKSGLLLSMRQQNSHQGYKMFDFTPESSLNASSTLQTPFACADR